MKLTEAEMRMVFQIESTNQNAALNEIYMTWRYAPNPATKETAESLLDKLRPLSDHQRSCGDLSGRCGQHRCGVEGAGKPRVYPAHPASG